MHAQHWEYMTAAVAFLTETDWRAIGRDGWELVAINKGTAYFKRPVYPRGGRVEFKDVEPGSR